MAITHARQARLGQLAEQLAAHWPRPQPPLLLGAGDILHNRQEAYFVQDAMARQLAEPVSGWKVGATSAKMREMDGHEDVIPGRIFASRTFEGNDLALPTDWLIGARLETEFAFQLTADLPDPASLPGGLYTAAAVAPMLALCPAFEVIGNRYTAPEADKAQNSLLAIGDNGGGVAFVFGVQIADWQEIDFRDLVIDLRVDGGPPAENFLGDMRGQPVAAVAELANHLAGRGYHLQKGDYVSTGAATVPQAVQPGSVAEADFGPLGRMRVTF